MIRVRLLSEPEYREMWQESRCREYDERHFYDLLREKGDFTDEASRSLLRHLHGEAAVTGKWYARTTPEGTACLPALSPEAKYGLVVIENSRKGLYTNLCEAFAEYEVADRMNQNGADVPEIPLVWDAFAKLDMDILLLFRKKDFYFGADIPVSTGFLLENHRVNGVPTEVWVEPFARDLPEEKNGLPCVANSFYDQVYQWERETEELLDTIRKEVGRNLPLAKGVFSCSEFDEMCGESFTYSESSLERRREEMELLRDMGEEYEPPEELWQVVNHMEFLPDDVEARRLRYLIITRYPDGNYLLRSGISVKYPSYGELFHDATTFAIPGGEILVLPVDVEEVMRCSAAINKAVCAFRVTDGVVETFGPKEGLREFAARLQMAVESGRCSISGEEPEKV